MQGKKKYKLKKYNMGTQAVDTPNYNSLYNMKGELDGKKAATDGFMALGSTAGDSVLQQTGGAAGKGVSAGAAALAFGGSALEANNEKRLGEAMDRGRMVDKGSYMRKNVGATAMKRAGTGASIGGAIGSVIPGAGTLLGAGIGAGVGLLAGTAEGYGVGKRDYNYMKTNMEATNEKFYKDKKANKYIQDVTREGDTGAYNILMAKNGMRITGKRYKTIKKR
jgi:hypothetical protein